MTEVRTPTTLEGIDPRSGALRAGGTDLHARHRLGVEPAETIIDLGAVPDLSGITPTEEGGWWIGAMERISTIATHDTLRGAYPALAATAGSLANPHIRQAGTVGGNLLQRTRCWYYRHPGIDCHKLGGSDCPARSGNHHLGVIFDRGPCVAPHPSSIAMALLTYDAAMTVAGVGTRTRAISELYGDGSDPTRDHLLEPEAVLTGIRMPPPTTGELAAYWRANSRTYGEWPLVEVVCRLMVGGGEVTLARVAAGGVAPVPVRLPGVEDALAGGPLNQERVKQAAERAIDGARPLPQTGYKQDLLVGTVWHVLDAAINASPHTEEAVHEKGLPKR